MSEAREVWVERVAGWRSSGETAREFASRHGINVSTLYGWAWRLGREGGRSERGRRQGDVSALEPTMIEVRARPAFDDRFEIELDGRRIRVPQSFDADALRRLIATLQEAS